MKKDLRSTSRLRKKILFFLLFIPSLALNFGFGSAAYAVELDPFPVDRLSRDVFAISLFREERPSFYWVNIGVPDIFFKGVLQYVLGPPPNPVVYSMRGVEYGVQTSVWCTDQLQLRMTLPFEANALLDATGNTRNVSQIGDLEVGATYILLGQREKGSFAALDGSVRFATGTNPFNTTFPLLSTGKGAPRESIGLTLCEEVGGFSFFQSVHYEKTEPIKVDSSNALLGPGLFQWPENLQASGRFEYLLLHRAQRQVSVYYELRMRMSGPMVFNGKALTYGYGQATDRLFFSTGGLEVRVDKDFSAEGKVTYFPFEPFLINKARPDYNLLFSMSLTFRPI